MNIINIIVRNHFLKQLFPIDITDFFVGKIELTSFDSVTIVLHVRQKPSIEVHKWGIWGIDFNIVTITILINFIENLNIYNWQNNDMTSSEYKISAYNNEYYILCFFGLDWKIDIRCKTLILQDCSKYLLNDN